MVTLLKPYLKTPNVETWKERPAASNNAFYFLNNMLGENNFAQHWIARQI